MQLMATTGHEYHDTPGLDWVAGDVVKISPANPALKVPHMGWNDLIIDHPHPIFEGIASGDHVYFVHSYHFRANSTAERLAHVDYAGDVTAVIGRDTMLGMQFHPEKSQDVGLRMIGNFLRWTP
jgi:glutamine amidotransferase